MGFRRVPEVEVRLALAAAEARETAVERKPSKRKGPEVETVRRTVVAEMRALAEALHEKHAHQISGYTLVSVWAWAHEELYGVSPASELAGLAWLAAGSSAEGLIRGEFGGDGARALDFVKWALRREQEREAWRKRNGKEGGRLTWRQLFSLRQLVVDYRVSLQRVAASGR